MVTSGSLILRTSPYFCHTIRHRFFSPRNSSASRPGFDPEELWQRLMDFKAWWLSSYYRYCLWVPNSHNIFHMNTHNTYSCDPRVANRIFQKIGPWPIEVGRWVCRCFNMAENAHPTTNDDVLVGIVADCWAFACCSDKSSLQKLAKTDICVVWNLRIYGQGWTGLKGRPKSADGFFDVFPGMWTPLEYGWSFYWYPRNWYSTSISFYL